MTIETMPRMVTFTVPVPDGYTDEERAEWSRSMEKALFAASRDAQTAIAVDRTIKTMEELGCGDHNSGNWMESVPDA